jgi:hypothetical protein
LEKWRSNEFELAAPVGGPGHRETRFEFGFIVDGENQGLRRVAAAFAFIGAGLIAPMFAGGADGGGWTGGLSAHGGWDDVYVLTEASGWSRLKWLSR